MFRKPIFVVATTALLLPNSTAFAKSQPTVPITVEEVIQQIKSDLVRYNQYAADTKRDQPINDDCKSNITITISSIGVNLATVTERSSSGSASAEVPIGPIKLGGSGGMSKTNKQSQTLKFKFEPVPDNSEVLSSVAGDGGFAQVLINLRKSLLNSGGLKPCLTFPPLDKQDNSIEFGFNVARGSSSGAKISFLIFSLGGERKKKQEETNSITVSFKLEGRAK
jgi:Trypsin-co-occurring domain 2